jgi:acyl-coenzyme A thioesterase PaaI-like protein
MEQKTHLRIDARWVGAVEDVGAGTSRVSLNATEEMAADDKGLVHGGFAFGLADYAAMVAVNDPNVVLGGAEVRFTAPVRVGQRMVARAAVQEVKGKKHVVAVRVDAGGKAVLEGTFTAFVLERHVLDSAKG